MKSFGSCLFFFVFTLLFSACENANETGTNSTSNDLMEVKAGQTELNLETYGMPMKIWVPDEERARALPDVKYNENTGMLEIRVGERFQLTLSEDEGDVEQAKADLDADLLFKNSYIKDEPDVLIYKSELPDGSKSFYHFYAVIEVDGVRYVAEDIKEGEFTEKNVKTMLEAVQQIRSSAASA